MGKNTNQIATWKDLSPYAVPTTTKCPTYSQITASSNIASGYEVTVSGSYGSNQCVRYNSIRYSIKGIHIRINFRAPSGYMLSSVNSCTVTDGFRDIEGSLTRFNWTSKDTYHEGMTFTANAIGAILLGSTRLSASGSINEKLINVNYILTLNEY